MTGKPTMTGRPIKPIELGDTVEAALTKVGITKERVEQWIGKCCCGERKERLNALSAWTRRTISGRMESAKQHLESLMEE